MNGGTARYSARVLDLFGRLPGAGAIGTGQGPVVAGEAAALDRGAWVRLEARVRDGIVVDCAFRAWGCPHVLAAASWVCSELRGLPIANAAAITARRAAEEVAAPAEKMGRLLIVEDALCALLERARAIQSGQRWQSR